MRWLTLYARSRQVPMALGLVLAAMVAVWGLSRLWDTSGPSPVFDSLALAAGAAIAGVGLGATDFALERTAAIAWLPRRVLHVLGVAVVIGVLLLGVQTLGGSLSPNGFVIRDSFGFAGLAALGATAFGGQYAWALPITWYAMTALVSPQSDPGVLTWLMQPPGTTVATVTATTLAVLGTGVYAVFGGGGRA
jgi:hypothetical protein